MKRAIALVLSFVMILGCCTAIWGNGSGDVSEVTPINNATPSDENENENEEATPTDCQAEAEAFLNEWLKVNGQWNFTTGNENINTVGELMSYHLAYNNLEDEVTSLVDAEISGSGVNWDVRQYFDYAVYFVGNYLYCETYDPDLDQLEDYTFIGKNYKDNKTDVDALWAQKLLDDNSTGSLSDGVEYWNQLGEKWRKIINDAIKSACDDPKVTTYETLYEAARELYQAPSNDDAAVDEFVAEYLTDDDKGDRIKVDTINAINYGKVDASAEHHYNTLLSSAQQKKVDDKCGTGGFAALRAKAEAYEFIEGELKYDCEVDGEEGVGDHYFITTVTGKACWEYVHPDFGRDENNEYYIAKFDSAAARVIAETERWYRELDTAAQSYVNELLTGKYNTHSTAKTSDYPALLKAAKAKLATDAKGKYDTTVVVNDSEVTNIESGIGADLNVILTRYIDGKWFELDDEANKYRYTIGLTYDTRSAASLTAANKTLLDAELKKQTGYTLSSYFYSDKARVTITHKEGSELDKIYNFGSFPMTAGIDLGAAKTGYSYQLLVSDGAEVTVVPVEVVDGKRIAYVDTFGVEMALIEKKVTTSNPGTGTGTGDNSSNSNSNSGNNNTTTGGSSTSNNDLADADAGTLKSAALDVGTAIKNGTCDLEPVSGYTKEDILKLQKESNLKLSVSSEKMTPTSDERQKVDDAVKNAGGRASGTEDMYFDITVNLMTDKDGDGNAETKVATVSYVNAKGIQFTVELSSDLQKAAKDGKHIYVARIHDGKVKFLDVELNSDKSKASFYSSYFSTFAVVAMDDPVVTSKKMGDAGIASYIFTAISSATAMCGVSLTSRNRNKYKGKRLG